MDAPPLEPPPTGEAPPEPVSLLDRLTNVIAAPGEAFDGLSGSPVRHVHWILPLILCLIGGMVYNYLAFSQPAILKAIKDQQIAAVQKQVEQGKYTQAQADQMESGMDRFMTPMISIVFGILFYSLAAIACLFLFAVAIWLLLKWTSGVHLDYMKAVEIYGLALIIDVPQKIIRIALVAWKGNLLATASPTLFLSNPSLQSKRDVFISFFDVVDFWWLAVMSLGVSKVAGIKYGKASMIVWGIWYGFRLLGLLMMRT